MGRSASPDGQHDHQRYRDRAERDGGPTIGAPDLDFDSINTSGATTGINLNATGWAGGLDVTGSGTTAGSGGTITGGTTGIALTTSAAAWTFGT